MSLTGPQSAEMEALLSSKTSQIESMELEISRLRAQLLKAPPASESEQQVALLEDKLAQAETAASKAQTELSGLRRSLDRTAEKAVREGSGRSTAETAVAEEIHEPEAAKPEREEAMSKARALEQKINAMAGLHKEQDSRMQSLRKEKESLGHEVKELRCRVAALQKRLARHGTDGEKLGEGGGLDDEGLDQLEAEERARLARHIRDLEAENYNLRRGIWHERRKSMQLRPDDHFQDVDLGSGVRSPTQKKGGGGLADLLASGINAITGADEYRVQQGQGGTSLATAAAPAPATAATAAPLDGDDNDGFLDDDLDFDEEAFRAAQKEEMNRRLERVREAKRALKNWESFKLDLVDARQGGGEGAGEIFEV